MTPENRDILLQLLDQQRTLGVSEQKGYERSYMDSLIASSASLVDLTPEPIVPEMADKCIIKPSIAEMMVDILDFVADKEEFTTETIIHQFDFTATTAKRYLRQLTEYGCLESLGGNRNRTYRLKTTISE